MMPKSSVFFRFASALLATAALLAPRGAAADPGAAASAAPAEPAEVLPQVALSADIVYQVLAAEIAVQRHLPGSAAKTYLDVARRTRDPRLARRATELAVAAKLRPEALAAARLWHELSPLRSEPNQALLLIEIDGGQWNDAAATGRQWLAAAAPQQRAATIALLEEIVATGKDPQTRLKALQAMLAGQTEPAAELARARAEAAAGQQRSAQQRVEALLAQQPDDAATVLLAAELDGDDPLRRPRAIARLQALLQRDPTQSPAYLLLGRLQHASGALDAAQQTFDALLAKEPNDLPGIAWAAQLRRERGDLDGASAMLERYLRTLVAQARVGALDRNHAGRLAQATCKILAQLAIQRNRVDQAAHWLLQLDDVGEFTRTAQQLLRTLDRNEAGQQMGTTLLTQLTTQLDDSGPRRAALTRIGVTLRIQHNDYAGAQQLLRELLSQNRRDPDLLYEYALVAQRLQQGPQAEQTLRQLIAAAPDDARGYNALGYLLADRGVKLDEARRLIAKALALTPDDPQVVDSMGWVEYRLGRLDAARKHLEHAWLLMRDPEIAAHLGEVLWQTGHADEARRIWHEGLAAGADNTVLRDTLTRFHVAPQP